MCGYRGKVRTGLKTLKYLENVSKFWTSPEKIIRIFIFVIFHRYKSINHGFLNMWEVWYYISELWLHQEGVPWKW